MVNISRTHMTLDHRTYAIESEFDRLLTETHGADTGHRAHVIQGNLMKGIQGSTTAPIRISDRDGYAGDAGLQITY